MSRVKSLKVKMKLTVNEDFSDRLRAGRIVTIDRIKSYKCFSGILVRVTGIWKNPEWFSAAWFKEFRG